jgi:hypothetical protein
MFKAHDTQQVCDAEKINLSVEVRSCHILVGFGFLDCYLCHRLERTLWCVLTGTNSTPPMKSWRLKTDNFTMVWQNVSSVDNLVSTGIQLRVAPTLLGFVGGKVNFGWEGFSETRDGDEELRLLLEALCAMNEASVEFDERAKNKSCL